MNTIIKDNKPKGETMKTQKLIIKLPSVMLIACLSVLSYASHGQQQGDPTDIRGSWSLNYDLTLADVSGNERQLYQKVSGTLQNRMRQFLNGRRFDFHSNGMYTITNTDGTVLSGSWTLNNLGLLAMIDGNSIEVDYIASLDGNLLILVPQGAATKDILFKRLFFNRTG